MAWREGESHGFLVLQADMDIQLQQKRRFPRVPLRVPVKYQVRGVTAFDNTICDNISENGLRITSEKYISPATPVMLEIGLSSRVLRPIARIQWVSPLPHSDRNRFGIQFLELDFAEKKHLADFIASSLRLLKAKRKED